MNKTAIEVLKNLVVRLLPFNPFGFFLTNDAILLLLLFNIINQIVNKC